MSQAHNLLQSAIKKSGNKSLLDLVLLAMKNIPYTPSAGVRAADIHKYVKDSLKLDDRLDEGFTRVQIRNAIVEGIKHFKIFKVGSNYSLDAVVIESVENEEKDEITSPQRALSVFPLLSSETNATFFLQEFQNDGWITSKYVNPHIGKILRLFINTHVYVEGEIVAYLPLAFSGTEHCLYLFNDRYSDNAPIVLNHHDLEILLPYVHEVHMPKIVRMTLHYVASVDFQCLLASYFLTGDFARRIDCLFGDENCIIHSFPNIYEASQQLGLSVPILLDYCANGSKVSGERIKFVFAEEVLQPSPAVKFVCDITVVKYLLHQDTQDTSQSILKNISMYSTQQMGANRSILCLDRQGRLLRYFDDLFQISSLLNIPLSILKSSFAQKKSQEWVYCGGFAWEYSDEDNQKIFSSFKNTPGRPKKSGLNLPLGILRAMMITSCTEMCISNVESKEVTMENELLPHEISCFSLDKVLLHTFRDASIAAAHIDGNPSLIIASCLKWIHYYHGFAWEYVDKMKKLQALANQVLLGEYDSNLLPPPVRTSTSTQTPSCTTLMDPSFLKCLANTHLQGFPIESILQGEIPTEESVYDECVDLLEEAADVTFNAASSSNGQVSANVLSSPSAITNNEHSIVNKSAKWVKALEQEGWTLSKRENNLIGLRVRRFFPKFGYTDGTITAYLPPQKNDNIPLWHIVHDDSDEEDLELIPCLQVMLYMQRQARQQPPRVGSKLLQRKFVIHLPTLLSVITSNHTIPSNHLRIQQFCELFRRQKLMEFYFVEDDVDDEDLRDIHVQFLYAILQLLATKFAIDKGGLTVCEMLAHFDAVLHPHHNSLLCQDLHDFVDYASKKDLCEVQYKSKQQSHLKRSPFDIRYRINPELCLDSRTSSASLKAIVNGENVITKLAPPLTASLTPVFNKEISSKSMNKAIVAKRRLDNKRLVPFRNIQEAAQKLVLDPFAIERVCEGDRSTLFGMEFYYIDAQQYPVMNARELEIACSEIRQYLEKSSKKYSTHLQGFTNSTTSATAASSSGNGNADKDGSSKNLQSLSNNNNRRTMNSSSQNYRIQISSPEHPFVKPAIGKNHQIQVSNHYYDVRKDIVAKNKAILTGTQDHVDVTPPIYLNDRLQEVKAFRCGDEQYNFFFDAVILFVKILYLRHGRIVPLRPDNNQHGQIHRVFIVEDPLAHCYHMHEQHQHNDLMFLQDLLKVQKDQWTWLVYDGQVIRKVKFKHFMLMLDDYILENWPKNLVAENQGSSQSTALEKLASVFWNVFKTSPCPDYNDLRLDQFIPLFKFDMEVNGELDLLSARKKSQLAVFFDCATFLQPEADFDQDYPNEGPQLVGINMQDSRLQNLLKVKQCAIFSAKFKSATNGYFPSCDQFRTLIASNFTLSVAEVQQAYPYQDFALMPPEDELYYFQPGEEVSANSTHLNDDNEVEKEEEDLKAVNEAVDTEADESPSKKYTSEFSTGKRKFEHFQDSGDAVDVSMHAMLPTNNNSILTINSEAPQGIVADDDGSYDNADTDEPLLKEARLLPGLYDRVIAATKNNLESNAEPIHPFFAIRANVKFDGRRKNTTREALDQFQAWSYLRWNLPSSHRESDEIVDDSNLDVSMEQGNEEESKGPYHMAILEVLLLRFDGGVANLEEIRQMMNQLRDSNSADKRFKPHHIIGSKQKLLQKGYISECVDEKYAITEKGRRYYFKKETIKRATRLGVDQMILSYFQMTAFRSCTIVDLCEALKKIPQYPTVLKEADTDFTELVKITVYNLCKDRKLWSEEDGMISLPTRFSWTKISELTVQRIMETSAFQLIIAQQQLQQQYSNTLKQKKLSSSSNNSAGDAMNVFI